MKWLLTSLLAFGSCSPAYAWSVLQLDAVSMEGWRTLMLRDPYMPQFDSNGEGEHWTNGAALNFDLSLIELDKHRKIYWNNRVNLDGTNSQVRHVAWFWDIGISLGPKLDLFYMHESRHVMEDTGDTRFPLRDQIGFRFNFFKRD